MNSLELRIAETEADHAAMLDVIHEAFAARKPLDPPAAALTETAESLAELLETGVGILVSDDGVDVATLVLALHGQGSAPDGSEAAMLHRVSVLPGARQFGVAAVLVRAAAELAADAGFTFLQLMARSELPEVIEWWRQYGFEIIEDVPLGHLMGRALPVPIEVPTAEAMQNLGERLAHILKAGDVLVATGELGAGKTTLTQGLASGLGVSGAVISPTFVLARVHPGDGGPNLVHVDAYRLSSPAELEDLDLETSLADSITLVEWGLGFVRDLTDSWLDITIRRSDDPEDDVRTVYVAGMGERWRDVDLKAELGSDESSY